MARAGCPNDPALVIAVDTSALMAVLLNEPEAPALQRVLEQAGDLVMSAGTLTEALIVAGRRGLGLEMAQLTGGLGIEIIPLTAASATRVAEAYARWGKGIHPAGLNFGDCFGYDVAQTHGCPLLFTNDDFARTDVARVAALSDPGA